MYTFRKNISPTSSNDRFSLLPKSDWALVQRLFFLVCKSQEQVINLNCLDIRLIFSAIKLILSLICCLLKSLFKLATPVYKFLHTGFPKYLFHMLLNTVVAIVPGSECW